MAPAAVPPGGITGTLKFRVEQVFLTDETGKVLSVPQTRQYHVLEAETVDEALFAFVRTDGAEIVGDVLKLPGLQAVATARRRQHVYTLQINPASERFIPKS